MRNSNEIRMLCIGYVVGLVVGFCGCAYLAVTGVLVFEPWR